jgi:hypothetical protein
MHLLGISRGRDIARAAFEAAPTDEVPCGGTQSAMEAVPPDIGLRWIPHRSLAAAVADPRGETLGPLRHAQVLAAIHRRICVLPVQFGTIMDSDVEVASLLQARRKDLLRCLDRLAGTCEMGLRISIPCPTTGGGTPHAATPAAGYLARRRTRYEQKDKLEHRACDVIAGCVQGLEGLYRQWRRATPAPPNVLRLAFLVEQQRVAAFRERVETLCPSCEDERRCTLLGPWPPYSFVY